MPLQVTIPHELLMSTTNPLLLICDAIQQALPEFLIPAVCAADGADPRLIELQFSNLRINLAKAGVAMLSWFHVPDGDAQIWLIFSCD